MGLFVDTVSTDISIDELGITLVHPTIDYDISGKFDGRMIAEATSLTSAIQGGLLVWKKTSGGAVELASDYDSDVVLADEANLGPGNSDDRLVSFKDLDTTIAQSASPGFTFGRSGNLPSNTWLLNESVPSNLAGRYVYVANAVIREIFVAVQNIATFDVAIYHHLGDETSLTFLFSQTVTSSRGGAFSVSVACPTGVQLAARIENGAAKQAVVGLDIQGSV